MQYAVVTTPEGGEPSARAIRFGEPFVDAFGQSHAANALEVLSDEELASFGVLPVTHTDIPAGQRETGELEVVEGQVYRVYEPIPLDDLKAERQALANAKRQAVFDAGYDPGEGPLAGHCLQLRGPDDKANWILARDDARDAVEAGHGDVPAVTVRTMDNVNVTLTPNQFLSALAGLNAWGRAVMAHSWALKDQIDAASDAAAVLAVDIDTGWPG
jgi:hypothetical protein